MIKSGETLLNIINDILLFSKIESGQLLIEHLPFSPMNAVEDVIDMLSGVSGAPGSSTGSGGSGGGGGSDQEIIGHFKTTRAGTAIPCPVWGDVMRLRQLLTNLLSNGQSRTHVHTASKHECCWR